MLNTLELSPQFIGLHNHIPDRLENFIFTHNEESFRLKILRTVDIISAAVKGVCEIFKS